MNTTEDILFKEGLKEENLFKLKKYLRETYTIIAVQAWDFLDLINGQAAMQITKNKKSEKIIF